MKKKYGKFYADWRDEKGVRHAKACNSRKAALRLTARMQRQARAKKAQASERSRRPSHAGPRPIPTRKTRQPISAPRTNSKP